MHLPRWPVLLLVLFSAAALRAEEALSVLFVGNSYTFVNDLPQVFREVVAGAGRPEPTVVCRALGGKTLGWYCTDAELAAKLDARYDVAVLQEQSMVPAIAEVDEKLRQGFLLSSRLLAEQVRLRSPGVRIVFFQTWARASWLWKDDRMDLRAGRTADEMQDRLTRWYAEAARVSGGTVAPVGEAWRANRRVKRPVELHGEDGSHPAWAGTYLAALVLAKTVYGPELKTRYVGQLKPATAQQLEALASSVVAAQAKASSVAAATK